MRMRYIIVVPVLLLVLAGWPLVSQQSKPAVPPREFTNSLGMKFVLIEPGTFLMGSESGDSDEKPVHRVTLTNRFYLQVTEVTQAQWKAVMGNNPSYNSGPFIGTDRPVEVVTWEDVQKFLKKLSAMEEGARYRLPTEAEWEYAARAGEAGEPKNPDAVAWYSENSGLETHPVGQKQPNAWGLYDMLGNVLEWCEDRYGSYPNSSSVDPKGPESGSRRVMRGGSHRSESRALRAADRFNDWGDTTNSRVGFRCTRDMLP